MGEYFLPTTKKLKTEKSVQNIFELDCDTNERQACCLSCEYEAGALSPPVFVLTISQLCGPGCDISSRDDPQL